MPRSTRAGEVGAGRDRLNILLYEDQHGALEQAAELDRAHERGALHGQPIASRTTSRRCRCRRRVARAFSRLRQPVRGDREPPSSRGRRDRDRQDEHGRVRDGLVDREQRVWADAQPARAGPRAWRIVGRISRRGRVGNYARRAGIGDGRIGASARGVLRHRRRETDVRPREPLRPRRVCVVARSDRRLRPACRRRGGLS